jgi:galactose mutarotase-like enzyme
MIIIENEYLRAVIAPTGAELQSLLHKTTGIEHLWNGDPVFWPKYSPVLFPTVGPLKDETYFFEDKTYQLPRHGFAREKSFDAEQVSSTEAFFTLKDDEQTLSAFPFKFILSLHYILEGHKLSCTYEVSNPGTENLLFSVGAHPAFAIPFDKGTSYSDYYLEFNKTESLEQWKLQDGGLIGDLTIPLPISNNRLALSHELFYEDAIVLKNMQSNQITIGCNRHAHGLHFGFNDFPYFGIWAAKDASFVCLEPWCGIADSTTHDQQLQHKEGIQLLAPSAEFKRTWEVECF